MKCTKLPKNHRLHIINHLSLTVRVVLFLFSPFSCFHGGIRIACFHHGMERVLRYRRHCDEDVFLLVYFHGIHRTHHFVSQKGQFAPSHAVARMPFSLARVFPGLGVDYYIGHKHFFVLWFGQEICFNFLHCSAICILHCWNVPNLQKFRTVKKAVDLGSRLARLISCWSGGEFVDAGIRKSIQTRLASIFFCIQRIWCGVLSFEYRRCSW